ILNRDVTLSVYLPEDYTNLFKYQLIFCFDGLDFFRFGRTQRIYEQLREEQSIQRAIIVGFHYEDVEKRREEFHPSGSRSNLTIKAMGKEILPYIDATFPTYKVGNTRLLIGDSLAGSIALMTAMTYPTIFSRVALLSPMYNENIKKKIDTCMNKGQLTIWHAIGLEEADFILPTNGKRANFLTPNRELNQLIKEDNIEYFYKEFNGGHHWKSWKPLLGDILLQFLGDPINGKYV
ncbi:esterase family protein, partial [Staphylococcus epidermidis]|nr:esterase family protein [Staphylococcus epidermidis]